MACSILTMCLYGGRSVRADETNDRQSPPNIVMIISDDQAWTDYGFMGHPAIQTPNLDRLAARSAVFRRGYTPVPLCRPSLLTMITGLYPHQHGVTGNDPKPDPGLSESEYARRRERLISQIDSLPTLPKLLSPLGYVSLQTGKWWEGNFRRGGFTSGMTRGFPEKGGRHGDDGLTIGRTTMQPVTEFIQSAKSQKRPFFLWYAPMLPHTPHDPSEQLLKKYQQEGRPEELARYFAMCERFDESCGVLLNCLEDAGLSQNTIVVYLTDNGWIQATPEMKLGEKWKNGFAPRSKQTVYEGGIRTPIMVSWPGRIAPGEQTELASTLDVLPTLLDAAGEPIPENCSGLSLLPLLTRHEPLRRTFLYGESFSHDVADIDNHEVSLQTQWCIEGSWKLIVSYESPADRYSWVHADSERQPQLFNVELDPFEKTNVAAQHPDVVRRLRQHMITTWPVQKSATGF